MQIEQSGPSRCPVCLRNKEAAIQEQLEIGGDCGNPNCIFAEEINLALTNLKISKFCIICGNKFSNGDLYCINCGHKRDD